MRYYVYILLDNRHIGEYGNIYNSNIKNKPFYVGKGDYLTKSNTLRHLSHYKRCESLKEFNTNTHKCNTIKLLKEQNFEPNYVIVYETNNELEALNVEIELIKFYGKKKDGGILTNITDGGVGGNIFNYVDGLRERLNKIMSERWKGDKNPNFNKKLEETYSHNFKKNNGFHWNTGRPMKQYTKKRLREERYKKIPLVEMVDINTGEIIDTLKTIDAIKKYNLNSVRLYKCLNEGGVHKNFYWKYKDKDLVLLKTKKKDYVAPLKKIKTKKIFFKYDFNHDIEYEFESIKDASKFFNLNVETIRRKARVNHKTTNIFRYEGKEYIFNLKNYRKKPIVRTDKDGNKKIFDSITEASKDIINGNPSTIVAVCKGKRNKHRGYKFEYLNNNDYVKNN